MNKSLCLSGLIVLQLAGPAGAADALNADWTVNTPIPEGNPVGMTVAQSFTTLPSGAITGVSVDLNISGGYNGGLYGYLVLQDNYGNTATEVLLNEIGTTPSNPFGSPGSGLDVTLSDLGSVNGSIHAAPGQPSGIWQPDSPHSIDSTFGGLTANGTWTLFLEDDFAGGGTSTLISWGLEVDVASAPDEAETGLLLCLCALLAAVGQARVRNQGRG